ncbi:SRPBCC family protein [Streptomyces sp. NPDC046860]|uniref:SRPBCC family protein n=1 Tax=Streptomyces sp. NPDC046860 TaxID=3154495 RepID=UPI0033CE1B61
MACVTLSASGAAGPETVWERYASVDEWASWSPQIKAVHCADRRLRPGMSGTVESVVGIHVAFFVEAVDEDHRTWAWRVRLGRMQIRLHHGVTSQERGTTTSLTMDGPKPALLAYTPLARLALHRLVQP